MDAETQRKIRQLESKLASVNAISEVHYWTTGEALPRGVVSGDGYQLAATQMLVVPIFPPGRMDLQAIRFAAGIPAASSSQIARVGLYRVQQPNLFQRASSSGAVTNLQLSFVDEFDVTYSRVGTARTAIESTSDWNSVLGVLERTVTLTPGTQYAIGIRVTGAVVFALASDTHFGTCPLVLGLSSTNPALPAEPVARTGAAGLIALMLLSPRGAAIIGSQ